MRYLARLAILLTRRATESKVAGERRGGWPRSRSCGCIGNPLSLDSTVSNGIVSAMRRIRDDGGKLLQITAPISSGSSGGPLFNMAGGVIGITTMYLQGGENLNFAIPINDAKPLLAADPANLKAFPDEAKPGKEDVMTIP